MEKTVNINIEYSHTSKAGIKFFYLNGSLASFDSLYNGGTSPLEVRQALKKCMDSTDFEKARLENLAKSNEVPFLKQSIGTELTIYITFHHDGFVGGFVREEGKFIPFESEMNGKNFEIPYFGSFNLENFYLFHRFSKDEGVKMEEELYCESLLRELRAFIIINSNESIDFLYQYIQEYVRYKKSKTVSVHVLEYLESLLYESTVMVFENREKNASMLLTNKIKNLVKSYCQ